MVIEIPLEASYIGAIVVITFLVIWILIGVISRRYIRSLTDYAVTGWRIGGFVAGCAMMSVMCSLSTFMGIHGMMLAIGFPIVACYYAAVVGFPLVGIVIGMGLRRFGAFTPPHFVGWRYGNFARLLSSIAALIVILWYLNSNMIALGKVFELMLHQPYLMGLWVGGLVVIIYVILGGMFGVVYNQFIQALTLFVAMIIPAALILKALGSPAWFFPPFSFVSPMAESMVKVNPTYFEPFIIFKKFPTHYTFYIAMMGIMVGMLGMPHTIAPIFTVKDTRVVRSASIWATFWYGFVVGISAAIGFAAIYYCNLHNLWPVMTKPDYDKIFFYLASEIAGSGWAGFAIGGALAAACSTLAGLIIQAGMIVGRELVMLVKPTVSEIGIRRAAYVSGAVVAILSIVMSMSPPPYMVVPILEAWAVSACVFPPLLVLGYWWKGANKYGAIATIIFGLIISLLQYLVPCSIWPIELSKCGPVANPTVAAISASGLYPLSFVVFIVASIIANKILGIEKTVPEDVRRKIDEIHGFKSYDPKRYTSDWPVYIMLVIMVLLSIYLYLPK